MEYKPLPIIKFPERKDQRLNTLTNISPKTFKSKGIEPQNEIFLLLKFKSSKSPKSFLPTFHSAQSQSEAFSVPGCNYISPCIFQARLCAQNSTSFTRPYGDTRLSE